jgi:hypothetical protein
MACNIHQTGYHRLKHAFADMVNNLLTKIESGSLCTQRYTPAGKNLFVFVGLIALWSLVNPLHCVIDHIRRMFHVRSLPYQATYLPQFGSFEHSFYFLLLLDTGPYSVIDIIISYQYSGITGNLQYEYSTSFGLHLWLANKDSRHASAKKVIRVTILLLNKNSEQWPMMWVLCQDIESRIPFSCFCNQLNERM